MQLGVTFPQIEIGPDPDTIVSYARVAEESGYDFIAAYDHVLGADITNRPNWYGPYTLYSQFHEIFTLFAFLAGHTRLELSTNLLVLPQRQTALVAKQAAEIDVLTRGRFRLGVGIGWNDVEYEALGENFHDRGIRCEEQIEVMRRLWTEESVTFHGRYHSITEAGILPRPVQQPIPVWIGGGASPRVLDRIGRLADGWLPQVVGKDELTAALATIRRAAEAAERDPSAIGLQGGLWIPADGSIDEARQRLDMLREIGATHATVITMDAGRSPEQHIDTIAEIAPALLAEI
ncbi:MAG: LLM class F420-dependent oxidoreductase [Acidimicrobiia bacterium]